MTAPSFTPFDRETLSERLAAELSRGCDADPSVQALLRKSLQSPVDDFLSRPSKGIRGALVEHAFHLGGGGGQCPRAIVDAVELLHAGSLIVDDIEDESKTRRGWPALHEKFGVPLALNAGNWLYFWALAQLQSPRSGLSPTTELALYRSMNRTLLDCHVGQALDLSAHVAELAQQDVPAVVQATTQLKTKPLMSLSMTLGATAAGAGDAVVSALGEFGGQLGVALQMLDDSGGLHSPERRPKGEEDLLLGRPTWPWAWLAEELSANDYGKLKALAQALRNGDATVEQLAEAVCAWPPSSGRARAHGMIRGGFRRLRQALPGQADFSRLQADLARLEEGYG